MDLGGKGMTVDAAQQCAKDMKEWRAPVHTEFVSRGDFCSGPMPFEPSSHAVVAYHLEGGGMPLDDVIGVNCESSLLFCLQLFSLSLLFLYRLVVWGWGLWTDRVAISLSQPCIANLF